MEARKNLGRTLAPLSPYAAVIVGLHVYHSAWLTFLIYHGLIIFTLAIDGKFSEFNKLRQGWKTFDGLGLMIFGLGGGALLLVLGPDAGVNAERILPILEKLGLGGRNFLFFMVYHSLVNPWMEEVFWRGHLGSSSRKVILNDALFAGYHLLVLMLFIDWVWLILAFFVLVLAAWFWRQITTRNGGLMVPALSHLVADGSIMLAVWVLVQKAH